MCYGSICSAYLVILSGVYKSCLASFSSFLSCSPEMWDACRNREGWGPISRNRNFDFTLCFEEGILFSTVFLLFGLAASFRCYTLAGLPDLERTRRSLWVLSVKQVITRCWIYCNIDNINEITSKKIFIALAVCISLVNAIIVFAFPSPDGVVGIRETYILEVLFLASSFSLTGLNHKRTHRSSSIILLFWPAYLLSLAVWTRTQISSADRNVALRLAVGALGFADFCLENVGPEQGTSESSDIINANIFSIWTFGWMTPLLKKGASQFITEEDLPALPTSEESVHLGHRLEVAMQNQYVYMQSYSH